MRWMSHGTSKHAWLTTSQQYCARSTGYFDRQSIALLAESMIVSPPSYWPLRELWRSHLILHTSQFYQAILLSTFVISKLHTKFSAESDPYQASTYSTAERRVSFCPRRRHFQDRFVEAKSAKRNCMGRLLISKWNWSQFAWLATSRHWLHSCSKMMTFSSKLNAPF